MFVPPNWFEGQMIMLWLHLGIPLIVGLLFGIIGVISSKYDRFENGLGCFAIFGFIALLVMAPVGAVIWHNDYEVPSVQEKIITVKEWQPVPGIGTNDNGMMVINNADQLMLITTTNEGFINKESGWFAGFSKWDTRDILNKLKVNGTYKIKYYGWRNAYNSGFPNILSVEEIIDESNATELNYNDLFGTKLS